MLTNKYLKILTLVLLAATPFLWFLGKGNVLITGLDTNFPLDPLVWFSRRLFVWNDSVNAGADFSSSTAGIFFHLIQILPYLAGFNLKAVEIISLVFWFGAIVFSSYFLSGILLPKNFVARIIFVVIYTFNIYLYNTWENIKVANLSLMVSLPLLLAVLHLYLHELISRRRLLIYLIIFSLFAAGTGINPAYFIALLGGLSVYFIMFLISSKSDLTKSLRKFFIAFLILFLVNSFWIFPLINDLFVSRSIKSLTDLGFTNWIASLSENTSILNVIRLQGAWDWYAKNEFGLPLYIPYSLNYFRNPIFILFSFIVPVLSLISLIFRKKDFQLWYSVFAFFALAGIFLGAGVHEPTGQIYKILVEKIPFFSFFRSPWYIFTPYLILAYAGLVGLLFEHILERFSKRRVLYLGAGIFIFGQLIYSYPLITGRIFREGRYDSFYVEFPDYVWNTKNWLDENPREGRIITYPDDQLEAFDWGYRGTETILGLFSKSEFITPSFNFTNKELGLILDSFYYDLKRGDYESASKTLPFLGADTIFTKFDTPSLSRKIDINNTTIQKLFNIKDIGRWLFLESKTKEGDKLFSAKYVYTNLTGSDTLAHLAKTFEKRTLIVNPGDSQTGKINELKKNSGFILKATRGSSDYVFTIPEDGIYSFYLEKRGNFSSTETATFKALLDGSQEINELLAERVAGFIKFNPVRLTAGDHRLSINFPGPVNLIKIDNYKSLSQVSSLRSEELPDDLTKTLVVYDENGENKQILIPISDFDPFLKYELSYDYRYVYGNVPIIDIIQSAPTAPVHTDPKYVGSSFDWEHKSVVIDPVDVDSKIEIFIKHSSSPGSRSKTYIENLKFVKIYENDLFVKSEEQPSFSSPDIVYRKINPTQYVVEVKNADNPFFLVFLESYSPSWQITSGYFRSTPVHFSANGYANAWYIQPGKISQEIKLTYYPQNYYNLGLTISLATIILSVFLSLKEKQKNVRQKA